MSRNALAGIICFLTDLPVEERIRLYEDQSRNALAGIICFLTRSALLGDTPLRVSRNALAGIICFLTRRQKNEDIYINCFWVSRNALAGIICFLTEVKNDQKSTFEKRRNALAGII